MVKKLKEKEIERLNLLKLEENRLYENEGFRKALEASKGSTLEHTIGKNKISETVLTKQEFCSRLTHLRDIGKLPVIKQKEIEFK